MFLKKLISSKSSREARQVESAVNQRVIRDTYKNIEKELNSLRAHDRGEKTIHAPDLRTAVRGIQRTT